jgi:hypothetical protein
VLLRNVGIYWQVHTALQHRRPTLELQRCETVASQSTARLLIKLSATVTSRLPAVTTKIYVNLFYCLYRAILDCCREETVVLDGESWSSGRQPGSDNCVQLYLSTHCSLLATSCETSLYRTAAKHTSSESSSEEEEEVDPFWNTRKHSSTTHFSVNCGLIVKIPLFCFRLQTSYILCDILVFQRFFLQNVQVVMKYSAVHMVVGGMLSHPLYMLVHNLLSEILKTERFFMEVDSNLNTTVTMTTMTTLMYPLLQDPQARCNVPLLHVYVQVYNLVWACLCLKIYWMFYLEIKSTLVILWSVFIPLKINNAINNIYQLALITCAILSLSSWPLIPLTTIPKSEKFRFSKLVWSQEFRIRDCVPVFQFCCFDFPHKGNLGKYGQYIL